MKISAYPSVRRDTSIEDDYHGNKISDPYRWLEDPDSEETKAFVTAQNAVTETYLNTCNIRKRLHSRITDIWDYPKYSCPARYGDKYYYYHNSGLQNQSVLYVQSSVDAEGEVFLDPNTLSEDGTIAVTGQSHSEHDKYMAYKVSSAGSYWTTVKFKDCQTGEDLPDVLTNVKFSCMTWTHDEKGMFYNRYLQHSTRKTGGIETTADEHQKLFYHVIGTDQSEDILCAEWLDDPKWMTSVDISDCGRYVIASIHADCDPVNKLYYCDLTTLPDGIKGKLPFVKVVDNFDAEYDYITNEGTMFTFKTNLNSPKYKIINIDISKPEQKHWTTLVDEHENDVLEWCCCVNHTNLVLFYMHDVKHVINIYDLQTGKHVRNLNIDIGSIVGFSGKKKYSEMFYSFKSFLSPGLIYRYDFTTPETDSKIFRETKLKGIDINLFETKQVFYPSKDGTQIPMFIVHKKGLELNGNHPVLLYGYGGFNVSLTPSFSPSRLVFLDCLGGILAVPNLRGGGEYGETWHRAGSLANKQNVFDDFYAAAEYLVEQKYTNFKKITINGGSNGGLLVGACANQRPDLFGCAVAQVPVMDMLRFHKFTTGYAWISDYGCADKKEQFEYLIKYSPLHTINKSSDVTYPAMLILTGDHDDLVVPMHSLKYIAQLQHDRGNMAAQKNPLLIKVDTKAGHGAGKPVTKVIDEIADMYSFISVALNLKWIE